ncbi:MAG TPA: hypothetical protein P5318_07280 [Candidatus Hydrogenedentes bacterium]|nr:hypothetical protein [Candidatus Hydrogenedentota bacterium]HPC15964.1 hypothetical protein [Candidatus Hydrogenedentota bacterium]HRT19918.1 hypothetical protein [Candidatus Hydrogenedentota bacterium]HRT66347.1 hypothetical protein [Candidatus Hydrogenedentota bacterium]
MKKENRYFDVLPKIVPADCETTVAITPLYDHVRFDAEKTYELSYYPVEEFSVRSGWRLDCPRVPFDIADGILRVRLFFEAEQEHVLLLEEVTEKGRRILGDFRVYSVEPDLFRRLPLKGDFHQHTFRSDGMESPGYVAASCRGIGLDFMAITDHRRYAPSLEAQRAFNGVDIALRIFPGEEVHPPGSHVHIVNFGGRFSINDLFADDPRYRAEVQALADRAGALPPGVDPYLYASSVWCFDKIREAGGLGIFCHPYWFTAHRYSPAGALTTHLFDTQPFDALELIGGYLLHEIDSNTLQVARYHEERAKGRAIPIVGASDAHGAERGEAFGWYYSIVFARSCDLEGIVAGVKALYSVAVEALPNETPRAFGPFRLVKYALFLMREVFPQHDELCREEGRLMRRHLAGDAHAAGALAALKERTARLMERFWGVGEALRRSAPPR